MVELSHNDYRAQGSSNAEIQAKQNGVPSLSERIDRLEERLDSYAKALDQDEEKLANHQRKLSELGDAIRSVRWKIDGAVEKW